MVAVSPTEDLKEMCRKLEQREIEGQLTDGRVGGDLYIELLAGYIAQRRLPEAKFLWKRIPDLTKQETPELGLIWEVGKSIWTRDNPSVFINLQKDWSAPLRPLMEFITSQYRDDAIQLVSRAYSTIKLSTLSLYLGLDAEQAGHLVKQRGWAYNQQTDMVSPVAIAEDNKRDALTNQLQRVADFISYLEN